MGTKPIKGKSAAKYTVIGIFFAVLGLALFGYFIDKAGPAEIWGGIKRLGFGFLLIFALGGVRQAVHAIAWVKCCEPPHRLPFIDAFKARLMGEGLGNIVPLGSLVLAEPSKPLFVRHRIPLTAGISALAIENLFYALSVALFISAGALTLLLTFTLPKSLRYVSFGALASVVVILPFAALVIRKQLRFISGAISFAGQRGIARNALTKAAPRVRTVEDRIYSFYQKNHARFFFVLLIEMCFHAAGVLEAYITLSFISATVAPTLETAFILESVNRLINVVFKFIPLRMGVDEGSTGTFSALLGLTQSTGVTLAIVRKARDICWTGVGLALMFRRGISLRAAARESEALEEELSTSQDALAAASAGKTA